MNELLIYSILLSFSVSFLVLVWKKTDIVLSYAKLFRLNKFFKETEYYEWAKEQVEPDYPSFLFATFPSFVTHLLTCPWCLTPWVSLIVAWSIHHPILTLPVSGMSILIYFVTNVLYKISLRP